MTTLIPVDGSRSSQEALELAAREDPKGDVLLLHVSPSARQADLERGRFLLEASSRACRGVAKDVRVHLRLEIGNLMDKLRQAAEGCDRVVMGAHGVNALPRLDELGTEIRSEPGRLGRPVLLVLPTGEAVPAGL
jgi:nucleotide-binding universal stress UspA family protein